MKPKKRPRVLIAEDEAHVRRLLKSVMESIHCDVVGEAENGRDAVSQYFQLKPHMLLLDINMPVKTGKTALAEILKRHPNAFVIMITSLTDSDTIEDCRKLGASGFIRKDLEIEEIKTVIRKTWRAWREAMGQANPEN
jgi:two-component system chemotaxis response regulator CheY